MIEIGLAFLEGLGLIASPCILPVLPLILAASSEGGRRRPYGIIIGFAASFTAFAVLSRKIVAILGIDLNLIKNASLFLLAFFGLALLSEKLSEKFGNATQSAADFGSRLTSKGRDGILSGIGIGSLIGLVWTPCAGPIMAAVLIQVIRQKTDLMGVAVIIAFSLGSALPMLAIALFGRRIMENIGFLRRHGKAARRALGAIILLSVAYIGLGEPALSLPQEYRQTPGASLEYGLDSPYPAPEFSGLDRWINSPPLSMKDLRGRVVLVDFWTYSCINCVRTLPHLKDWDRKYRGLGLTIVGIHSPEFEFEKKFENVAAAVKQDGITYPVAQDNELATWDKFRNSYWPAHYLIDREGRVVYTHFGEGEYDVTENNIRHLLGIEGKTSPASREKPQFGQTPETYLGYARAENFVGIEKADSEKKYRFPAFLPLNAWALEGKWRVASQKIVAKEKGSSLRLNFKAAKVFLVLGTESGKPLRARILLDGEQPGENSGKDAPGGFLTIKRNTLYEIIDQKSSKNGLIEIQTDSPGLEAYAFTFG